MTLVRRLKGRVPRSFLCGSGREGLGRDCDVQVMIAPPLVVHDLLADLVQVIEWLAERLEVGDGLDAYLLAAGAVQIVEDYQHRDIWSIRRIAAALARGRRREVVARLLRVLAAGLDFFRRVSRRDRFLTGWLGRLVDVRDRLAFVVLKAPVTYECNLNLLLDDVQHLRAELPKLPAWLTQEVLRLPSCFRSFDQRPSDCVRLAENFVSQAKPKSAIVVGVRTSGSYLAPLVTAALANAILHVETLTVRPGRPLRSTQRAVLGRIVRCSGHVLVVDDPPVSGEALREVIRELRVPSDQLTLLIPSFEKKLPEPLRRYRAVTLPFDEWAVHTQLTPQAVQATLTDLIGARVNRVQRLPSPAPDTSRLNRGNVSALYLVDIDQSASLLVMVSGAGLGYFGRHVLAVAQAIPQYVPRIYGFRDGLLFRSWLPEEHRLTTLTSGLADQVAAYVSARAAALPTAIDRSRGLSGRKPVWEVASMLIAGTFGRLGIPLRPVLLDIAVRRLTAVRSPSVVDGDAGLHRWFFDGSSLRTITSGVRAFSNFDLACYDPAYDVAGVNPGGRHPHVETVRRCYEVRSGRRVDGERLLLYELVHLWNRARNGYLTRSELRRASSRSVQRYLAACYLSDLPTSWDGPLVALDCDGVLETHPLGYPTTTPAGALALRSLRQHGYQPVIVTGRSVDEVRERCETYNLAGGVAEYGAVVYRHDPPEIIDLLVPRQRVALDSLRKSLAVTPGVELDADYSYTVRAFCADSRGQTRKLSNQVVSDVLCRAGNPSAYVVAGEGQTDFVAIGIDKGKGLRALARMLGSRTIALAVGDTASDLPMLSLAHSAYFTANASRDVRGRGIPVLRQPYQAGLSAAVARLLGHRPGNCPSCRAPAHGHETRLLLAMLAAPEAGRRGLPGAICRTAFALLASGSEMADQ